ncbi:hypothetical protein PENNAL_c0034G08876 [Penicillium nalgiovense]|uniref:Uncharacterized protein n=1 Tax=Penicillium nalgiovense TaxID=60175 RepID=A0A1V6Y6J5_PENNA|nr:hypothetical protein PENNAL_c0034G08876 [Penicillium nalgiovense]
MSVFPLLQALVNGGSFNVLDLLRLAPFSRRSVAVLISPFSMAQKSAVSDSSKNHGLQGAHVLSGRHRAISTFSNISSNPQAAATSKSTAKSSPNLARHVDIAQQIPNHFQILPLCSQSQVLKREPIWQYGIGTGPGLDQ